MRKSFLLLVPITCVTACTLAAFALRPATPTAAATLLRLADLTLDRVFRQTFPNNASPTSVIMPATVGVVITSISMPINNGNVGTVIMQVNGNTPETFYIGDISSGGSLSVDGTKTLDPPLIVKPNDVLTITSLGWPSYTLGGFFVFPGEV